MTSPQNPGPQNPGTDGTFSGFLTLRKHSASENRGTFRLSPGFSRGFTGEICLGGAENVGFVHDFPVFSVPSPPLAPVWENRGTFRLSPVFFPRGGRP